MRKLLLTTALAGTAIAVIGGAGKTTLLRTVPGLLWPTPAMRFVTDPDSMGTSSRG